MASERAFSTINFLQSKIRNRLSIEHMNMLCFIYINVRSIRAATKQKDGESELLKELMADLLLNQEDDLVRDEQGEGDDDDDDDEWEDLNIDFFDVFMT